MDCVEVAGARHYEKSRLTLVDSQAFFHFSGCRPIFALGPLVGIDNQVLKIGWPRLNRDALTTLHQTITPSTEPLRIVCAKSPQPNDFVCERAKAQLDCPDTGRDFQLCKPDGEQREKLLAF